MKYLTVAFVACVTVLVCIAFSAAIPRPQESCAMMDTQRDALYCTRAVSDAALTATLSSCVAVTLLIVAGLLMIRLITGIAGGTDHAATMPPVPQRHTEQITQPVQILIVHPGAVAIRGLHAQVERREVRR